MDILKDLNDIIWDMDTKNRMPLIMKFQESNVSDIHLLGLLDDTAKIRKTIISYFENLINNSNNIQGEHVYMALIKYYEETHNINSDIIIKLIEQSRKNKFKNFHNQDFISEDNLEQFISESDDKNLNKTKFKPTKTTKTSKNSQGERIREIRTALKMTQDGMGKALGISKQFLSRVENSIVRLSSEKLIALSKKYNVDINYVLTGNGNLFLD
jgi:DNA-binding transcriptional regulator YiaG